MDEALSQAEQLEPRRLLSSAVRTGDTLRVFGDVGVDNVITVGLDAAEKNVIVVVNGQTTSVRREDLHGVRIFGDSGNDTITINSSQAIFDVQTSLFGGAGDDRLKGGDERDYIEGNDGDDRISLGNGRNFGLGDAGTDIIDGGDQRDFISGGAGPDLIHGGADRDQLQGDNGDDTIFGGTGDDADEDGSDLIFGGRGNDLIFGQGSKDVIFGQDGNDTINGGSDRDEIFGMAGDDVLDGGTSRNTLWGGDGNDTITGVGSDGESHQGEYKLINRFIRQIVPHI
jgi:Ca2+-binding RTX toxin-like protein